MSPTKVMLLLLTGITFVIAPGAARAAEPQLILVQFQKDKDEAERRKHQQQQQQQQPQQQRQNQQPPQPQRGPDPNHFPRPNGAQGQPPIHHQNSAQDPNRFQRGNGLQGQSQNNAQQFQQQKALEQQRLNHQRQAQDQQKILEQKRALELKRAQELKALELKKAQQPHPQRQAQERFDQHKPNDHKAGQDQQHRTQGAPAVKGQGGWQPNNTATQQHQHDLSKQQDAHRKTLEEERLRAEQARIRELQEKQRQTSHQLELEKQKGAWQAQQAQKQQTIMRHELSADEQRLKAEREAHRFDRERLIAQQRRMAANEKSEVAINERLRLQNERLRMINSQRREIVDPNGHKILQEPGNRTIFRAGNQAFIRHDEAQSFHLYGGRADVRNGPNGHKISNITRPDGSRIEIEVDSYGRPMRRVRHMPDGRRFVLFENRALAIGVGIVAVGALAVALAPPHIDIPREDYIVDAGLASEDDMYNALEAPPVEPLERTYTLDEVLASASLRDRLRSVNIDTINFDFGSWEIGPEQAAMLETVAAAIRRIVNDNPAEVFLIEGHTDAVGSDEDNLSLSDRRAQAVADALSQQFSVPRENLVTQGYGKQFLLVPTDGPERRNRRVVVRRLTPLLQQDQDRVSSSYSGAPEEETPR
jgi:outer membrane protein OmpA-like peptidoglycan-associated protein